MALSFDSSAISNTTGTSVNVTLSTSNANDVIIAAIIANVDISTVTASGLTFARAPGYSFNVGGNAYVDMWWAYASSALSSKVITVTPVSSTYVTVIAFGITGANTTTPFDGNAATAMSDPVSLTTTNANTMLLGLFLNGVSTAGGSGYTQIQNNTSFNFTEYQIVSAAGTYSVVTNNSGLSGAASAIAVVQAGAAAAKPFQVTDASLPQRIPNWVVDLRSWIQASPQQLLSSPNPRPTFQTEYFPNPLINIPAIELRTWINNNIQYFPVVATPLFPRWDAFPNPSGPRPIDVSSFLSSSISLNSTPVFILMPQIWM